MRILQVTPRYPPRTGGVETHVREISERLVKRGHEVTVVTADAGNGADRRERRNGVDVRRHRGFAPSGAFHVAPSVLASVRRLDADIVHAHNYHALPLLFAALGTGNARLIVTPHYHGGSASSFRDRLLTLYRPFGRWALRRADAVVAVSEWERDQLKSDFGVTATVVPNGVNVERFRKAEPERRDAPYLLTVGRLEQYKGVQHVIRALPELPEYELLVAGSGPYEDGLREVAMATGVSDRVEFLGYVDDDRLPGLYAGAAVYITMSSFEAYGMTVGEALAAGTPCVVRKRGALVDWTGREGCVGVSDVSPEVVAGALGDAVGLETDVARLPTWEGMVNCVEELYDLN